jgi:4-aminobutyrate--pyruvate transaminase
MGDSIAFCPPLITTAEQVTELFVRFERAMQRFEDSLA